MHDQNSFDLLPAFGRGWVTAQTCRSTDIRLETGELVHARRVPALNFGTYLTVTLFNRLRDGSYDGEIYDVELPPLHRHDDRTVLFDESNLAGLGENPDPAHWHYGATKLFSLAQGFSGYHVCLIADPYCRKGAYNLHRPSARAIAAIQARPGWTRRTYDYFGVRRNNADIACFELLAANPSAILVTGTEKYASADLRRRFPNLDTLRRRVCRATLNAAEGRIEVAECGVSEVIAYPLFSDERR